MKEKKFAVMDDIHSELLLPPHVVNKLIDLLVGDWYSTPLKQEQLTTQLSECSDCRIAFLILLVIRGEYEAKEDYSERFIQDFSTQFRTLHDQIEARRFEYIGAYAEKIVAEGRKKANKQFPILAEYIKRCPSCKLVLEDTLDFLRETEKIDQHI